MDDKKVTHNITVSTPFMGFLGITFIVLKILGYITWPWLWVLSPFWIPIALWIVFMFFIILFAVIASLFK